MPERAARQPSVKPGRLSQLTKGADYLRATNDLGRLIKWLIGNQFAA